MFSDVSSQLDLSYSSLAEISQEWCCVLLNASDLQFSSVQSLSHVPLFPTQESNKSFLHCRWILLPDELPRKPQSSSFVAISHSVVSGHGLQYARLPCLSQSPRACSNSCPLNWWHHPTVSSSVILFSSCLQSFPESVSFRMSRLFPLGGQGIGASASTSVPLMNIQD